MQNETCALSQPSRDKPALTDMDQQTRQRLTDTGWRTGSAQDFLGLSDSETEYIEMKLALAADLRARRHAKRLTQTDVARLVGSSQSRVAKMEAADSSVSVDLLVRVLLMLGAVREDVAKALSSRCG